MEFILTPWGNSQVFISVQYLLVSLPILADNLSQQGSWFSLAAQPRASADAPKAHPGRDPAQGWVKPIPIGWLQTHLGVFKSSLPPNKDHEIRYARSKGQDQKTSRNNKVTSRGPFQPHPACDSVEKEKFQGQQLRVLVGYDRSWEQAFSLIICVRISKPP